MKSRTPHQPPVLRSLDINQLGASLLCIMPRLFLAVTQARVVRKIKVAQLGRLVDEHG